MKNIPQKTLENQGNIVIAGTAIHMVDGLYSLNDLHRASGRKNKHRPSLFVANQETQALIREIELENPKAEIPALAIKTVHGGHHRGTYVCKELVYRYAMWISPKFSLMVIRAFDALNTGAIPCLQKTTVDDRTPLRQAVSLLVGKKGLAYDTAYNIIHQYMGVSHIDEIPLDDLPKAISYVHNLVCDNHNEHNALWKLIGLLEYERIDKEIRELKRTIDTAYQQIERISRTKGLIYDAISVQKTNCPYNTNRLNEAKAFIEKQMVIKKQHGLIA